MREIIMQQKKGGGESSKGGEKEAKSFLISNSGNKVAAHK